MTADDTMETSPDTTPAPTSPMFAWVKAELKRKPERLPRALLLMEGAQFLEHVGRLGEAAKAMVAAANSDPLLLPAVWHLLHIFQRRGSWTNVTRLREAEQKAAVAPAEKALAFVSWGELQEDRVGALDAALGSYRRAVEADPKDRGALLSLERAAARAGDLGLMADALEKLADLTTDEVRRGLILLERARVDGVLRPDKPAAALAHLERAARLETLRWHWLGALEKAAERVEEHAILAGAIEGKASIMEDFVDVETAARAVRAGAPRPRDPDHAARIAAHLWRKAARVRDRFAGDRVAALDDLRRARALRPRDRVNLETLLALLERDQRWDEAFAVVAECLAAEPDAADAPLLEARAAELAVRAGRPDVAAERARAALARTPRALMPLLLLEDLLPVAEQWGELAAAYERAAEALRGEDEPLSAMLLVRAAAIADRHLGDADGALRLLGAARERSPHPGLVTHQMLALEGALGHWPAHAELLAQLAQAATEPTDAVGYFTDLALVQEIRLDDGPSAADTYAHILAQDPGALWALAARIDLLSAAGAWPEVAGDLERLASADVPEDQAVAALSVAGWLYASRCDRNDDGERCFRAALDRGPDAPLAAAGLELVARLSDDSARLRRLLAERVAQATSGPEVERLLLALALEHEKVGELEPALDAYSRLAECAADSRAGQWGQVRCLRLLGRYGELAEALEALDEPALPGADRAALLLELGEVYLDRLGREESAADCVRRALEADPDALPAVFQNADVARREGAWDEVDEMLQEMLRLAPETALLVADERLAVAAGPGRTDDVAAVIDEVLLENIPDHRAALVWQALLGARTGAGGARAEAWARLADLEGATPLGDAMAAHAAAIGAMGGTGSRAASWAAGRPVTPEIALRLAESTDLADEVALEVFAVRRDLASDPGARAFWSLELAERLERVGRLDDAAAAFAAVLDSIPSAVGALEGRLRLARALHQWAALGEAAERLAEVYAVGEEPTRLLVEAAEAWRAAGEPSRVEGACRRALARAPADPRAFELLVEVLRERSDVANLVQAIEARASVTADPAARSVLWLALAGLLRDLGRHDDAVARLEDAASSAGADTETRRALAVARLDGGAPAAAAAALSAWADVADEEERRVVAWRAAELLLEHGEAGDALRPLEALIDDGDTHPETQRRLLAAARRARAWPVAAGAAGRLAELSDDPDERRAARRAKATILGELAGDRAAARLAWQEVVADRPSDVAAIEQLVEATAPTERDGAIASLHAHLLGTARADPTAPDLLRALVRLREMSGSADGQLCALQVLDAVGALEAEEAVRLAALRAAAPPTPQRPLDADELWKLRHPDRAGLAESLLQLLGPLMYKIFAADVAAMKLARPLKARGGDLLLERIEAAAEVFGVQRIAVCRSAEPTLAIAPVPDPEPTIAVGPTQAGDMGPATRFALGRAVWHVAQGTAAFASRSETQIRAFHDAVIKDALPDYQPRERRLGVDILQRDLHRSVPRRSRKQLVDLGAKLARADEAHLTRWCHAVKASADRAGLLLATDVGAALATLVPGWRGDDPAQRAASAERVRASVAAREILVFALSDDYVSLRRSVGLAVENW